MQSETFETAPLFRNKETRNSVIAQSETNRKLPANILAMNIGYTNTEVLRNTKKKNTIVVDLVITYLIAGASP